MKIRLSIRYAFLIMDVHRLANTDCPGNISVKMKKQQYVAISDRIREIPLTAYIGSLQNLKKLFKQHIFLLVYILANNLICPNASKVISLLQKTQFFSFCCLKYSISMNLTF